VRCDALLYYEKKDSLDRTLALTIAGLVLFIVANTFPFLAMKSGGLVRETTLITGIKGLYLQGMEALALLVLLTSILVPFVQIAGMLYVLVPLKVNRVPRNLALVYRFLRSLQPWGMMEVFMLGILVSYVKLGKMAKIVPGLAIYSFVVLIFVLAGAAASMDPRIVWDRLGES
jgi:paraquat-inducible protein A